MGCLLDGFLEPTLWLGRLVEETTSVDYRSLTKSHSQNTNPSIKSTSWKAKVWKQKLQAIWHTYLTFMFVWWSPLKSTLRLGPSQKLTHWVGSKSNGQKKLSKAGRGEGVSHETHHLHHGPSFSWVSDIGHFICKCGITI